MEQRQYEQDDIVRSDDARPDPRQLRQVRQQRAVAQHRAFGTAARAAGVKQDGEIFGAAGHCRCRRVRGQQRGPLGRTRDESVHLTGQLDVLCIRHHEPGGGVS